MTEIDDGRGVTKKPDLKALLRQAETTLDKVYATQPRTAKPILTGQLGLPLAIKAAKEINEEGALKSLRSNLGLDDEKIRFSPWPGKAQNSVWSSAFAKDFVQRQENVGKEGNELVELAYEKAEQNLYTAESRLREKFREVIARWHEWFKEAPENALKEVMQLWNTFPRPEIRKPLLKTIIQQGALYPGAHAALAQIIASKPVGIEYDIEAEEAKSDSISLTFIGARNTLLKWKENNLSQLVSENSSMSVDGLQKMRELLEAGLKDILVQLYDHNLKTRLSAAAILSKVGQGFAALEKIGFNGMPENPYPTNMNMILHDDEIEDLNVEGGARIINSNRVISFTKAGIGTELTNAIIVECCRVSRTLSIDSRIRNGKIDKQLEQNAQEAVCYYGASQESAREMLHCYLEPLDADRAWHLAYDINYSSIRDDRLKAGKHLSFGVYDVFPLAKFNDRGQPIAPLERRYWTNATEEFNADKEASF
jgi:hypothetical protein